MIGGVAIKRIYEEARPEDGMRVLVDRLWPRGLTREAAAINYWAKDRAPSPELRKWYDHEIGRFAAFRERYLGELAGGESFAVALLEAAGEDGLTLLYAARDPVHNHAVVLADWLRSVSPGG